MFCFVQFTATVTSGLTLETVIDNYIFASVLELYGYGTL